MQTWCVKCLRLSALLLLGAIVGRAQPARENWNSLNGLAPGAEIRVILTNGKTVRGFYQSATADVVVLNAAKSQEMLARVDVKRVQLKKAGHRGRNTLIGLGVGGGAGLIGGAIFDEKTQGDFFGEHFGKVAFGLGGGLIGTVIGVAWPTGGWRDVYRAP